MKNRKKRTINDLMKKLGIDKRAEFMGFAVHHEKRDEFLFSLEITDGMVRKGWAKTPQLALTYDNQLKTEKIAKKINDGSFAVALFDLDMQILVSAL